MFLELQDIAFGYRSGTNILNEFNLNAQKGEILALIGPSGSGKSTVLRLIAGLEMPRRGVIRINHKTVASPTVFIPPEKRNIGMVFQDFALFPHLTVARNIAFGLREMTVAAR